MAPKSGINLANIDRSTRPQDDLFRLRQRRLARHAPRSPATARATARSTCCGSSRPSGVRDLIEEAAAGEPGAAASPQQQGRRPLRELHGHRAHRGARAGAARRPARRGRHRRHAGSPDRGDRDARSASASPARSHLRVARRTATPDAYCRLPAPGRPGPARRVVLPRGAVRPTIRAAYVAHVGRMLTLAGVPDAAGDARATGSWRWRPGWPVRHWDNVRNRDAVKTYNPVDRPGLKALVPAVRLGRVARRARRAPGALDEVVVRQPSFVTGLGGGAGRGRPRRAGSAWLALAGRRERARAATCRRTFVEENFDFYGRTLTGAPEQRERWKRGVGAVEGALGEAVGRLYVERHFPPAAKARMERAGRATSSRPTAEPSRRSTG